jgi:two-component system OmpR family sensor kinase
MTDPQTRIAQLEAELAAARQEMQDFTQTVSHDLRAPLRHIVSYARLVQEDAGPQLNEEVRGFLSTITDASGQLSAMLDALLELSRLGTVPVQITPVALQPLVQEVCDEVAARNAAYAVDVRVDVAVPEVLADAALLRHALRGLLANAWKFTATTPEARVVVSATLNAQGMVVLTVQDNGVGYNPALQGQLFKMFSRLHSTSQFPGLGSGLALARKAVQRMGGDVQVSGAVNAGCRATLLLPGVPVAAA